LALSPSTPLIQILENDREPNARLIRQPKLGNFTTQYFGGTILTFNRGCKRLSKNGIKRLQDLTIGNPKKLGKGRERKRGGGGGWRIINFGLFTVSHPPQENIEEGRL